MSSVSFEFRCVGVFSLLKLVLQSVVKKIHHLFPCLLRGTAGLVSVALHEGMADAGIDRDGVFHIPSSHGIFKVSYLFDGDAAVLFTVDPQDGAS